MGKFTNYPKNKIDILAVHHLKTGRFLLAHRLDCRPIGPLHGISLVHLGKYVIVASRHSLARFDYKVKVFDLGHSILSNNVIYGDA